MKQTALLILIVAFITGVYLLIAPSSQNKNSVLKKESLELGSNANFVTQDFVNLFKQNKLPPQFWDLNKIEFLYHDPELQKLVPPTSLPFRTKNDGKFKLEVETFSAPDENKKIIVLQLNVLDLKSKNKVYELSRNYEVDLEQFKKEKPD